MSGVLNVSDLDFARSRDNQLNELSLRQNQSYLKQFDFVRLSSDSSLTFLFQAASQRPANDFFSSLARPRSTRRDRGSYAGRVVSRSTCSNSSSRPYRQKKDNYNSWFDLGDWINYPMRICGTSLNFLPSSSYG
jgi:hypothetical protein